MVGVAAKCLLDTSNFRVCIKSDCFIVQNRTTNLNKTFSIDSMLFDSRIHRSTYYTNENLKILQDSGVLEKGQDWRHLLRLIYRVILTPEPSILKDIEEVKSLLYKPNTFGVHIRSGGYLANSFERMSMISESGVRKIPQQIRQICKERNIDPNGWNVFISSDSDSVARFIKKEFNSTFNVVISSKYKRGHTTSGHLQNDSLKSALIDLHILGDCSLLLVTKGSGFSTVAESMAFPSPVYFIPVNRTILPRLNDTSQIYLRESSLLYFVYYKQFTRQNAIVSDRIIANDSSQLSKVQLFISFIPTVSSFP